MSMCIPHSIQYYTNTLYTISSTSIQSKSIQQYNISNSLNPVDTKYDYILKLIVHTSMDIFIHRCDAVFANVHLKARLVFWQYGPVLL